MNKPRINSKYFNREKDTFVLLQNKKEPDIETKYKVKDVKGETHNIYITKRNYVYFIAKDNNGIDVKRKVSKEIADIILKELGRIKE